MARNGDNNDVEYLSLSLLTKVAVWKQVEESGEGSLLTLLPLPKCPLQVGASRSVAWPAMLNAVFVGVTRSAVAVLETSLSRRDSGECIPPLRMVLEMSVGVKGRIYWSSPSLTLSCTGNGAGHMDVAA